MTSSNPPNITHSHCMVPNMFANPLLNYGFWGVLNTMILSNAVGYILPMSLFQKGSVSGQDIRSTWTIMDVSNCFQR